VIGSSSENGDMSAALIVLIAVPVLRFAGGRGYKYSRR
jgi:hypothetical protein